MRVKYEKDSGGDWEALVDFEWGEIKDQDIWEIISQVHSESSDAARRSLLKLYTYETPLYSALNKAN